MLSSAKTYSVASWVRHGLIVFCACAVPTAISRAVEARASLAGQPLYFEANHGQLLHSANAQFFARTHEALFALSSTETIITLSKTERPNHSRNEYGLKARTRSLEDKIIRIEL